MKRYEIFSYFCAVLLLGSVAGANEDVFVTLPINPKKPSFGTVEIGPCRWGVYRKQLNNHAQTEDDDGYEMGLHCTETENNRFEVTIGTAKNRFYAGSDSEYFIRRENEKSIFIMFKHKIGGRRGQ